MRLLQLLFLRALLPYHCFAALLLWHSRPIDALTNGVKTRSFVFSTKKQQPDDKPKLVVITGCPGTGKYYIYSRRQPLAEGQNKRSIL